MQDRTPSRPAPDSFGDLVRRRREDLGLSLRETARRIGISPSYLIALERGRNPSTGRPPLPSPPILTAIAEVLEFERSVLLDLTSSRATPSSHVLLFQEGSSRPALDAARRLLPGRIGAWIEIADPRLESGLDVPSDLLARQLGSLGGPKLATSRFVASSVLAALSDLLATVPPPSGRGQLGIVSGANSSLLRAVENPQALLDSEQTWAEDVRLRFRAVLDAEPAATICIYAEADLQEIGDRLDPLSTVVSLLQAHSHVAVEDRRGELTTGPAAIETILATARPTGTSSRTWAALTRAAATGFTRDALFATPPEERP